MVYCLQAELVYQNQPRRNQVLTEITNKIGEKQRWGETTVEASTQEFGGGPTVSAEARFSARADLDEIIAAIESFLTGQLKPVAGSWYALHECPHDEAFAPCIIETRRMW